MEKKHILIYCYDYHPLRSVGALRPYAWAKHLAQLDFEVTVVTRKWDADSHLFHRQIQSDPGQTEVSNIDNLHTVKVPYKARFKDRLTNAPLIGKYIRKSLTLIELLFKWYLSSFDEKDFLRSELFSQLATNKFDLIIVSGEPYILFKHVLLAYRKYRTPYVLDYRDGWSFNEVISPIGGSFISIIRKKIELRVERSAIANCLFLISVHSNIVGKYKLKFPDVEGYVIENGTDLDLLKNAQKSTNPFNPGQFVILYTGIIYPKHNVSIFIEAVEHLLENSQSLALDLKCFFVGIDKQPNRNTRFVESFKEKYPNNVEILESISHFEAVRYQLHAQLLLKFSAMPQIVSGNGAKIYEYVATRNPILTVQSTDDKRTTFFPDLNVQRICINQSEIEIYINEQYTKWKKGESLKSNLTYNDIYKISREYQCHQLAALINKALLLNN